MRTSNRKGEFRERVSYFDSNLSIFHKCCGGNAYSDPPRHIIPINDGFVLTNQRKNRRHNHIREALEVQFSHILILSWPEGGCIAYITFLVSVE